MQAKVFVCSKYEEIYPPELHKFVYITDDTYTDSQVLNMERKLLNELDFRVSPPTCACFLRRLLHTAGANSVVRHLANYLLELAAIEYAFVTTPAYMLAAAALALAHALVSRPAWVHIRIKMVERTNDCY